MPRRPDQRHPPLQTSRGATPMMLLAPSRSIVTTTSSGTLLYLCPGAKQSRGDQQRPVVLDHLDHVRPLGNGVASTIVGNRPMKCTFGLSSALILRRPTPLVVQERCDAVHRFLRRVGWARARHRQTPKRRSSGCGVGFVSITGVDGESSVRCTRSGRLEGRRVANPRRTSNSQQIGDAVGKPRLSTAGTLSVGDQKAMDARKAPETQKQSLLSSRLRPQLQSSATGGLQTTTLDSGRRSRICCTALLRVGHCDHRRVRAGPVSGR